MRRSTFMTLSAATSLVCGLAALFATSQLAATYGVVLEQQADIAVKLVAASYLGYAVTNWLGRNAADPVARRAVTFGNFAGWAVSIAVGVYAWTMIPANAATWMSLAVPVAFTAGWGYYAFVDAGSRVRALNNAASG